MEQEDQRQKEQDDLADFDDLARKGLHGLVGRACLKWTISTGGEIVT